MLWHGWSLKTCLVNKVKVLVAQSCPTLWDPMNCSPPGSSVHGILQARILVAISYSRGSSRPRNWTWVSHIAGRFFTVWSPWWLCRCSLIQGHFWVMLAISLAEKRTGFVVTNLWLKTPAILSNMFLSFQASFFDVLHNPPTLNLTYW